MPLKDTSGVEVRIREGSSSIDEMHNLDSDSLAAICIAAHVAAPGGLLKTLSGQSAIDAWRSPHLLACALPGPIGDAPANLRPIIENGDPDYRRERSETASRGGLVLWLVTLGIPANAQLSGALENRCSGNPATEGSNPSPSAL